MTQQFFATARTSSTGYTYLTKIGKYSLTHRSCILLLRLFVAVGNFPELLPGNESGYTYRLADYWKGFRKNSVVIGLFAICYQVS
jgi:hypothetical protein